MLNKQYKYRQLCWTCANCYGGKGCPWIDRGIYPDGVKLDRNNFIVACPDFKSEKNKPAINFDKKLNIKSKRTCSGLRKLKKIFEES